MACFGVLGERIFGVFLYFMTNLCASGVLEGTATLVALTRSGDDAEFDVSTPWRTPALDLVGSICHRSTGALGGCFRRIMSLS